MGEHERAVVCAAVCAIFLTACGAVARGGPGDSGTTTEAGGTDAPVVVSPGQGPDGGLTGTDATVADSGSLLPDGTSADSGSVSNDATVGGAGPVDAGYYYGDGSYWVDGGAYPDAPMPGDASGDAGADGETIDASPGCLPLAACCPSVSGATQSVCESIAQAGNGADCGAELALLQGAGDCTGATVLASLVQVPPDYMVSDGTTLFWLTSATPGLLAMPVEGGPITTLLTGPGTNDFGPFSEGTPFLAVDDITVYLHQNEGITRIPKAGGPATLVNESGAAVYAATSLASTAYWVESAPGGCGGCIPVAVKSAPFAGWRGPVGRSVAADSPLPDIDDIAVTPSAVFIGFSSPYEFSMSANGMFVGTGERGTSLTSDNGAV